MKIDYNKMVIMLKNVFNIGGKEIIVAHEKDKCPLSWGQFCLECNDKASQIFKDIYIK